LFICLLLYTSALLLLACTGVKVRYLPVELFSCWSVKRRWALVTKCRATLYKPPFEHLLRIAGSHLKTTVELEATVLAPHSFAKE
jgi:hypothetical protein